MSKFFVASESDNETEEEEQKQNDDFEMVDETEQKPAQKSKASSLFDDSWKDDTKRVVKSEKQKRWAELRPCLDEILDSLELGNFKASFEHFQKLGKLYSKAEKAIAEHGHPNFFVRSVSEMVKKVHTLSTTEKDLRRFNSEIDSFIAPFNDILSRFDEHPEEFEKDDEDEEGDEVDPDKMDEDQFALVSSDDENGASKWFLNDDNEDKTKDKDQTAEEHTKEKQNRPKGMSAAEAIEARIAAEANATIDDATIREELKKATDLRMKGKTGITTKRLSQLLDAVMDEEIESQLKLELCYTVLMGPSDIPISIGDWELLITYLPNLKDHASEIVPLLERMNSDFWARSIDPRILFTPDVSRLHNFLPTFIKILTEFAEELHTNGDFPGCIRVDSLLLEHLYHNQDDAKSLCLSILKMASEPNVFEPSVSSDFQTKAAIFYAINLAVRGYPIEAKKIIDSLPAIPVEFPITQIMFNRALAEIGKAAFIQGEYEICYQFLYCFRQENEKDKHKNRLKNSTSNARLGQNPAIYPPWLIIQPKALEVLCLISAMILDLSYYSSPINDGDNNDAPIDFLDHKSFQGAIDSSIAGTLIGNIIEAMERMKNGEWKESTDILGAEFSQFFEIPKNFALHVKLVSLGCYLMSAYRFYDSVSVAFLAKMFDLQTTEIVNVIKQLLGGKFPVVNFRAKLNASLVQNDEYLKFIHVEVPSPLVTFGSTIAAKTASLTVSMIQQPAKAVAAE